MPVDQVSAPDNVVSTAAKSGMSPSWLLLGIGAFAVLTVGIMWWKLSRAEAQVKQLTREVAALPTQATVNNLHEEWARQFVAKQAEHQAALFGQLQTMQKTVEATQSLIQKKDGTSACTDCDGEECCEEGDCDDCECDDCDCEENEELEAEDADMPVMNPIESETKEDENVQDTKTTESKVEEPNAELQSVSLVQIAESLPRTQSNSSSSSSSSSSSDSSTTTEEDTTIPNVFSAPPPKTTRTRQKKVEVPEESSMDLADDTD